LPAKSPSLVTLPSWFGSEKSGKGFPASSMMHLVFGG
jgi:hypothetical protein